MTDKRRTTPDSILEDYLQELLPPAPKPQKRESEPEAPPKTERHPPTAGRACPAAPRPAPARRQAPARTRLAEPPRPAAAPLIAPRLQEKAPESEPRKATPPETKAPAKPAPTPPRQAPEEPKAKPAPAAEKETEPGPTRNDGLPPPTRWIHGRPAWAQEDFDCLLFTVAGLKLAVPLVLLGAIHQLDRELTPLVGRPAWFMGLLPQGERNIRVVDTARWVMPQRYPEGAVGHYRYVIRLDDNDWGLACDEVAQSFRLAPDEVKWRGEGSKRPWLAGTVKKQMCALLDVAQFARLLARAERDQKLDLN